MPSVNAGQMFVRRCTDEPPNLSWPKMVASVRQPPPLRKNQKVVLEGRRRLYTC